MLTVIHYSRVAYYRLWKPRLWRSFVQKRVSSRKISLPNDVKPLFFNAEQHIALSNALRAIFPDEALEQHLFTQAREAISHQFAFFSETLREHDESSANGKHINWHKDYVSGRDYTDGKPLQPSHTIDFMTSEHGSDVKYAWELNRCQWFTWLGMAQLLDRQTTAYTETFARDVRSWLHSNPVGMGVNWTMPMEAAIRATNWILAHSFFHNSEGLTEEFWGDFMQVLWQHGKFLSYNLEYVRHNANHFLSNAMGLVVIGAFFFHRRDGRRWFYQGKRFLEREIRQQFTKDGVNYEKSTSYHRFTVEMLTLAAISAERIGSPFSAKYYERLTAAIGYMAAYMRPDGTAPNIGDTDNGRVLRFRASEDFRNHLTTLICSSVFLKKPYYCTDFATIVQAESVETTILTQQFEQLKSITSPKKSSSGIAPFTPELHFIQGGYIVHKTRDTHLFVDVGDYGMDGWGGHGHNDCLSFEFWLRGQTIFTDSGTGCYTSNVKLRNELRSTKAHNTVMVGGKEQIEWLDHSLWRIKRDDLDPSVLELRSGKQGSKHTFALLAEHSAYKQRFGVQHRRGMRFIGTGEHGELVVTDELIPFEQAMIGITGTAYFHLAQEIIPKQTAPNQVLLQVGSVQLQFTAKSPILLERCRISRFYGDVQESWRLGIECSLDARAEVRLEW